MARIAFFQIEPLPFKTEREFVMALEDLIGLFIALGLFSLAATIAFSAEMILGGGKAFVKQGKRMMNPSSPRFYVKEAKRSVDGGVLFKVDMAPGAGHHNGAGNSSYPKEEGMTT